MSKVTPMPKEKAGGFTLVEAMISLFFVAFIASQLAMISIHGAHTSALARRVTKANMLADEAIEKTRNVPFPNIQNPIGDLGETSCAANMDFDTAVLEVVTCPPRSPLPPMIDRVYRRYRIVRPIIDSTVDPVVIGPLVSCNKAQVDVIVEFTDVRGTLRQVRVSSVVSRY